MNRRHPIISRAWLSASKRTAEAKVQRFGNQSEFHPGAVFSTDCPPLCHRMYFSLSPSPGCCLCPWQCASQRSLAWHLWSGYVRIYDRWVYGKW